MGFGFSGSDAGGNNDLFDTKGLPGQPDAVRNDTFQWGGVGHDRTNDDGTPVMNPDGSFVYGPTGAQQDVTRYQNMGAAAGSTAAPTINKAQTNSDAGQAYDSRNLGMQSRENQNQALNMMRDAAQGNAPSAAALQMKAGTDAAMRSQLALAAGARGASALAGAQYNAAGNNAALNQQNTQQTGILRAQEMAQARGAFGQQAGDMRNQDAQQRSQDLQARGMSAQEAQAQAQLEMQQRGLNQQGQMGYEGMAMGVNQAQLNANVGMQSQNQQQWATQAGLDQNSTKMANGNAWGAVSGVGSLLSDARLKENIEPASIYRGDPYGARSDLSYGSRSDYDTGRTLKSVGGALRDGARAALDGPRSASEAMLDQVQPYSYSYKPGSGEDPNRLRYGVMAQDLQKSPMGATLVEETPHGKAIDSGKAAGVNLAALADLHQRVKAIEAQHPTAVADKVRDDKYGALQDDQLAAQGRDIRSNLDAQFAYGGR